VIVSTDDKEIVEVATSLGAEVPFLRSEVNSNDYATTYDVIKEVSEQLLKENYTAQFTCCLYPTAPFVTTSTLIESYNRLNADTIDAVFSYTQFDYPIQRRLKMDKGLLTMAEPQFLKSRSQDLEEFYHDAGQFYFYNTEKYLSAGSVFNLKTQGILFPPNRVQDIDTQEDWEIAELKHKRAFFEN
jgi:pseudaminic acid cytidylyltransferase